MEPNHSALDVPRCDLCDTDKVHSYCDLCHVNLCKPCIGEHISDGYDKHKIVPFKERRSTLIYPKCNIHPSKNCKFQCKGCNNIFVCSSCTASRHHKGHDFVDVTEAYKKKKEDIKMETKQLENHISPTYEEIALDMENQLANLDGGYQKLITTISKQGEQWHREIDIVINKMKTEINEINAKHRDILQKHLDEISKIQSLIKQTVLTVRELEKSIEVSHIIGYRSKISELSKLPPKVKVTLPTFTPKPIDQAKLCRLFGQINPLSTAKEKYVLLLNNQHTLVRDLLDQAEVVATIETESSVLRNVTCLNEDKIWTSGLTNSIKCYNNTGSLLQTTKLEIGEWPSDITVDNDGNLLYSNEIRCTVNKVENGRTEELITLQGWAPANLCATLTGDILVTMYSDDVTQSKVVLYSGFIEKQTIQFDNEGKPLYSGNSQSKYITENRNHDICVADFGAGAVVVVNQDGKLRWRYTGHHSVFRNKSYEPYGITTDSQCRILTADGLFIHILNKNGQFLHYIDKCDLWESWGVCVDNTDSLFVCDSWRGEVKKIKYL